MARRKQALMGLLVNDGENLQGDGYEHRQTDRRPQTHDGHGAAPEAPGSFRRADTLRQQGLSGETYRLAAAELERFVAEEIKCIGRDTDLLAETLAECRRQREEAIGKLKTEKGPWPLPARH